MNPAHSELGGGLLLGEPPVESTVLLMLDRQPVGPLAGDPAEGVVIRVLLRAGYL